MNTLCAIFNTQEGSRNGPGGAHDGPHEGPTTTSKGLREGGPREAPREIQEGLQRSSLRLEVFILRPREKEHLLRHRERPRGLQGGPQKVHEGPKKTPRGPREGPERPRERSKRASSGSSLRLEVFILRPRQHEQLLVIFNARQGSARTPIWSAEGLRRSPGGPPEGSERLLESPNRASSGARWNLESFT